MTTDLLAARITALEPKLRKIAHSMARDDSQADDLFQAAALRIISTCSDDDTDALIVLRGKSAMRNEIKTNQTRYNNVVCSEDDLMAPISGSDDDDDDLVWDRYVADQTTPEDEVIGREHIRQIRAAIASLTPDNQKVVQLLAIGKSQADIARELGVSRAAISIRVGRIADSLIVNLTAA